MTGALADFVYSLSLGNVLETYETDEKFELF